LLEKQAKSIGIELLKVRMPQTLSMEEYDKIMTAQMSAIKSEGINVSIFGDIFLEDIRNYRESASRRQNFKAAFPLWKKDVRELAHEFISLGFKAIVACVDGSKLSKEFVGKELDEEFIANLPQNVCPCGENGEYHTFVFDGPIFNEKIDFKINEIVEREFPANEGKKYVYHYCDLE